MKLTAGELFAGIGGIGLGLERTGGFRVVWQVERDEYCRRVLAKHWPDVSRYGEVEDVGAHNLEQVDLISGGFPCQPVSQAGKREAERDERWLWPEFERVLRELRPRYVLVENVPGLLVRGMGAVLGDLARLGYDAEWESIPAAAVGAPHLRYRVFLFAALASLPHPIGHVLRLERQRLGEQHADPGPAEPGDDGADRPLAHANGGRGELGLHPGPREGEAPDQGRAPAGARRQRAAPTGSRADVADPDGCANRRLDAGRAHGLAEVEPPGRGEGALRSGAGWWAVEPDVGRVADGVPARVDRNRALGNAVVPQVAEWIGYRILEAAS